MVVFEMETFGSAPATSQEYEASIAGDAGSSKWLLRVLAVLLVVAVAVTVVLLGR